MPAPCQSGKTAPFQGLGGMYNLRQISAKEMGKNCPQRGMNTLYSLWQLIQTATKSTNRVANTATESAKVINTATKSAKAASTSRGGQCEQPSHVHGV